MTAALNSLSPLVPSYKRGGVSEFTGDFPQGNRDTISKHLKNVLSESPLSPSILESTVDNLLKTAQGWDSANFHFNQWIWADLQDVIREAPFLRVLAFLRILGQKYYERTAFDAVYVLKTLSDQAYIQAFLDGLGEGPAKGKWTSDRYTFEVVSRLLKQQDLNPDCVPFLEQLLVSLQLRVDKQPTSVDADVFDIKVAAAQEKELLTPMKRVLWEHIIKLYHANIVLVEDLQGDKLAFKECLLDLLLSMSKRGKLSQPIGGLLPTDVRSKNAFYPVYQGSISPQNVYYRILHMQADPRSRAYDLREVLKSNFSAICDKLTKADKENICMEMEKIILDKFYVWNGFQNTIDDRKQGWLTHTLESYSAYCAAVKVEQHSTPRRWPNAPLDQCERNVSVLTEFTLKLDAHQATVEFAAGGKKATQFILEHRRSLVEKALQTLLQTASSCHVPQEKISASDRVLQALAEKHLLP